MENKKINREKARGGLEMKIAILGAGAMGCLIGAHLKKGGAEVWLIDPYRAHMDMISEKGLLMELENEPPEVVYMDGAVTHADEVGICDGVIVLCKCVDTEKTMNTAGNLIGEQTVLLTMQNGIGNVEILEKFVEHKHIGFGVLKASATLIKPGKIVGRKKFVSSEYGLYFSPVQKDGADWQIFRKIEEILVKGGFDAALTSKTEELIWDKLYMNIMYNMPCALLKIAGEDFMRQPEGEMLLHKIADEFCMVANAKGFSINKDVYWENYGGPDIKRQAKDVRHYTSAVVDAARKRKTEVEFITGAVYREAQKLGIAVPYNETIYWLIKVMESTYDLQYSNEI